MTLNLVSHFRMLGRYNRLANARLYGACSDLDDEYRKRDRGAFFGSIHGTLNHILVGDRIWMTRFEGGEAASTNLDAILYEDFPEMAVLQPRNRACPATICPRWSLRDDMVAQALERGDGEPARTP